MAPPSMPPSPPRRRRWLKILGLGSLLVALLAAGLWWGKERWVGLFLGRALGAPIHVGKLQIQGWDHFTLFDIEIGSMAGLDKASVAEARVEASLRQLLNQHLRRLELSRTQVHLRAPFSQQETPLPRIDLLKLVGLEVRALDAQGADSGPLLFQGELRNLGEALPGSPSRWLQATLHGQGEELALGPWFQLLASLPPPASAESPPAAPKATIAEPATAAKPTTPPPLPQGQLLQPRLHVELSAEGRLSLSFEAESAALRFADGREASLLAPRLEGHYLGRGPEKGRGRLQLQGTQIRVAEADRGWLRGRPFELTVEAEPEHLEALLSAENTAYEVGELHGDLPASRLQISARKQADFWDIEVLPTTPLIEQGRLRARWFPAGDPPPTLEGSLTGIDLAALSPLLPLPAGMQLTGRADVILGPEARPAPSAASGLASEPTSDLAFAVAWRCPRLAAPWQGETLRLRSVEGQLRSTLREADWLPAGPLFLRLTAAGADGPLRSLFPLSLGFEGQVEAEAAFQGASGEGRWRGTSAALGQLEASGPFRWSPTAGLGATLRWTWGQGRAAPLLALLRQAGTELPADLTVEGELRGKGDMELALSGPSESGPSLQASGEIRWQNLAAAAELPTAWTLADAQGLARWSWKSEAPGQGAKGGLPKGLPGRLQLQAVETIGTAAVPPLPAQAFALSGAAQLRGSRLSLSALRLDAGSLGRLDLSAESDGAAWTGGLNLSQVELRAWRDFVRPMTGELASGLTVQGSAEAQLRFAASPRDGWRLEGPAHIEGSGFSSEDGSRVLEGLASRWQLKLGGGWPQGPNDGGLKDQGPESQPPESQPPESQPPESQPPLVRIEASAQVGGFQLLWDLFFGDFSTLETGMTVSGQLTAAPDEGFPGWDLKGTWRLPDGPVLVARIRRAAASGDLTAGAAPALSYQVDLGLPDLQTSYERHLKAPLLNAAPQLERLQLGGDLRATARGVVGPDGTTLEALLVTEGLTLEGVQGQLALRNLDLSLPLDLRWNPQGDLVASPGRDGAVRFQSIDLRGITLPPTASRLRVEGDQMEILEGLVLPVAGGEVSFTNLKLVDLLKPERYLDAAIRLRAIDLERLTADLGLPPLEGQVEGQLPRIRLDASKLRVEGGGEAQLFGGRVRIGDISGQDILSRFPKITFSAEFEELDLGRLTRRFDVGEMKGVLQGSIDQCELFRGVPVRCKARLETVKRRGVPRTISVKAINNIAILGTGQGASFLDRGIHKLFNRYTYDRLGITMDLAADVFLLRGLEERRGRELFLRGRLPFPIDVVNAQPGRTVSFQTMLRRLESLDFQQATTSP